MKIREILKTLVEAENYAEVRVTVPDNFIDFIKNYMKRDYEYIKEKEEIYQELKELLNNIKT